MNITHLCQFCNLHELETVDHVITRCPLYDYERQSMLVNLQLGLSLTPLGLAAYHAIAELDQQSLTLVLLGQHDPKCRSSIGVGISLSTACTCSLYSGILTSVFPLCVAVL